LLLLRLTLLAVWLLVATGDTLSDWRYAQRL
jgi:hypothetical protein